MNDKKYFGNTRRVEEIILQLDGGNLHPEEATELFEKAKELIDECEIILNSYSGTVEEMSFMPTVS